MLKTLMHPEYGVIKNENEITAVGHRVVHGGEKFSGSVLITQEVINRDGRVFGFSSFAQSANLKGIYAYAETSAGGSSMRNFRYFFPCHHARFCLYVCLAL